MRSLIARRDLLRLATGSSLLLAGACSTLISPAAPRLFSLKPPATGPSPAGVLRWKLAVAAPDAPQALDTSRIALRRGPFEIDYFAGAAWSDHPSGLVEGLLIDAIEATGRLPVVQRDTLGMRSDFLLLTQLKSFEAQYAGAGDSVPEIRVRIVAQMARAADREILDSLDAAETRVAATNSLEAVILAFNECSDAAMARIVAWVLETGQRSYGASS